MITIEKLNSIESLLSLTQFTQKLKPKSVLALTSKICSLQTELNELRKNDRFNELLDFVADNWSEGSLGPDSKIKEGDRVDFLFSLMNAGIVSKRILGKTTNMVVDK